MFAMDIAALPLMAGLTAVMLAERTLPGGPRLTRVVGSALLLLAALSLWHPAVLSLSG
jgi:predicted metal-binding membrane protein